MEQNSYTVTLTPAMVRNGYIDLPMSAKDMFPSDSLGSWSPEGAGATFELRFGEKAVQTDVCIKSSRTLAFRARMTRWLQRELLAHAGDRLQVVRLADRLYQLVPLAA